MDDEEQWRPVAGSEGLYEVSDRGRVRSVDRAVSVVNRHGTLETRSYRGRLLKPGAQRTGHVTVAIRKGRSVAVHVLVAAAFLGPRPEKADVLHRDGDPSNNHVGNLRYGTRSDNNRDVVFHGRRKLSVEQVRYLQERAKEGFYHGERYQLSRQWGVNSGTVWAAAAGKEYSHV